MPETWDQVTCSLEFKDDCILALELLTSKGGRDNSGIITVLAVGTWMDCPHTRFEASGDDFPCSNVDNSFHVFFLAFQLPAITLLSACISLDFLRGETHHNYCFHCKTHFFACGGLRFPSAFPARSPPTSTHILGFPFSVFPKFSEKKGTHIDFSGRAPISFSISS